METIRSKAAGRRQRGASAVEFAIVAPLLFFLLFAIVDACAMLWVNLTMQHAVREGARYAVTGQADLDPRAGKHERFRAVIEKIRDSSMGLYDRVSPSINGIGYGNPDLYHDGMFGVPGEIFVLRIDCNWPVMTPMLRPFFNNGTYQFSVASTMRNEAYK